MCALDLIKYLALNLLEVRCPFKVEEEATNRFLMNIANSIHLILQPTLLHFVLVVSVFGYQFVTNKLCQARKAITGLLVISYLILSFYQGNPFARALSLIIVAAEMIMLVLVVHKNR